ncbi:MAG: UDP-2,4-diacetamido-2,4,6-trideoxy-beta-L-altropyranose hydrolase [Salegentibacter mishustinae]|nr:UDP-2,4-diacetamido-2,4,6-trideoxy-beta-L-altropyranose hydrolase [Salegentibacter mishustinae]
MKEKKVYIRADGSPEIGLGHLVRCIALAHMIKNEFQIYFFSKEIPDNISNDIIEQGFSINKIETENDFLSVLNGNEIVILDHYDLYTDYQKKIKLTGCKLVCIDDLHDKEFFADVIINHAPGISPKDYHAQSFTQFALGLDYALLRPIFLETSENLRQSDKRGNDTVFICFGGVDILNLTKEALEVVLTEGEFEYVNVVVGNGYKEAFYEELKGLSARNENLNLFRDVTDEKMVEIMQKSNVAIVPCSGILLEALSLGLEVISGMYVQNQKFVYRNYKEIDAFIDAGNFSKNNISKALKNLTKEQFSKNLVDGHSGKRINKLLKKLIIEDEISLRTATIKDLETTFRWATNAIIRQYSFNKKPIEHKEHSEWFERKLDDVGCVYFIAEKEIEAIGSVRFDIGNNEAVISYLVDPIYHSKGYGIILLQKSLEVIKNSNFSLKKVVGYVEPDNIASIKVFQRLGYTKSLYSNNRIKFIKELK